MVISTVGIEANNTQYIDKVGKFLFKIEKFLDDGFTNAGDQRFKLMFKGVENGTKEPIYTHSEQFNIGQKSLWRIKQVEVALKAPETYEVEDFVGRYVIANIGIKKEFTDERYKFEVKSWEYSSHNDKLTPIPEAKQNANNDTAINNEIPTIIMDDDSIPFAPIGLQYPALVMCC